MAYFPPQYQEQPTIKMIQGKVKSVWIVSGDPCGPLAHHWCTRWVVKFYRTEKGAQRYYAKLVATYERRKAYQDRMATVHA